MPKVRAAKAHAKAEIESPAGLPLDGLPQQVDALTAWQKKEMPDLFRQAFPEADSLKLRDRVLAELLELILSGQLHQPGKLASENGVIILLSEKLKQKISRTPVREALAILVRDGFVRQLPQKGFEVVEVSADETREVLSLCGEVEALAIERLITTERSPDLEPLLAAQSRLAAATKQNDRHKWMLGDTAFHAGLAQSAGLKDAALSIRGWRQKVHLYSRTHFEQDEGMDVLRQWQEHDGLVQAITDRQADRAVELLDQHLEHTTDWLGLSVTTMARPGGAPIPTERPFSEQEPTPAEGETPTPEELAEAAAEFGWPEDLVKRALTLGAQPETLLTQIESGIRADQAESFIAEQERMREALANWESAMSNLAVEK